MAAVQASMSEEDKSDSSAVVRVNKHLSIECCMRDKYLVELCDNVYVEMTSEEVDSFRKTELYLTFLCHKQT